MCSKRKNLRVVLPTKKRKRQVEDKKELEPKTPLASTIELSVCQHKSVERLVASIEGELTKEIHIKKAAQFKSNISRFSGFVWHENEEKQKMKVKENLDKCVKEKLLELCDVLDIPVAKATSRKSSKGKKREQFSKKSPSLATGSLEGSTKMMSCPIKLKVRGKTVNMKKNPRRTRRSISDVQIWLSNKEPAVKVKTKTTPSKSSKASKKNVNNDANPKVYSKKKTTDVVKGKSSTPKKPSSKDNTGEKILNGKGHNKVDKLRPSAICEVLKEVDFNTATFSDIVNMLAKRYDTDLTPRKSSVKNMIQDELTRLVDEADEDDEEETAEEDEKQHSIRGVKA
ncbi:hypothetical protein K7X08_016145 [Anisodus acutangulus]|uniref:DEK-C domain-containing protein n=1 Tax=Anisodus acutangulus TaxID=402998 RepID=A0A9Q1LEN4_9SOLA|nr:hypothetical protein K7X08_016145 [Anisodus acutangulus]